MVYELNEVQVRVLGSLMEKENATPDYYPLTLNGLMNACNQKSSREPVLTLDENEIVRAIDALRALRLAWMVQSASARVPKYEHNFDRELGLTLQETAAICVLMLRGPQTIGEIRGRSDRIYPFESLDEVSVALDSLLEREEPLVMKLPLQVGRKEARYCHLLSGEPDMSVLEAAPPTRASASAATSDASAIAIAELQEENLQLREQLENIAADLLAMRDEFKAFRVEYGTFKSQFD